MTWPRLSRRLALAGGLSAMGASPTKAAGNGLGRIVQDARRRVESGQIPCARIMLSHRGRVILDEAIGWADIARKDAIQRDTIFRWRSLTKPVITVAALQLVDRGRLALDAAVGDLLPAFSRPVVYRGGAGAEARFSPARRPITVRHLMAHTAGYAYQPNGDTEVHRRYRALPRGLVVASFPTLRDAADAIADAPLMFDPGEGWEYGLSTDILARVVEVAAAASLPEVLRTQLFEPLEMTDAGFSVEDAELPRFTSCYATTPSGLQRVETAEESPFRNARRATSGGGGLVGRPDGYLRFAAMLAAGGATSAGRVLSRRALREMTRDARPGGVALPAWTGGGPGLGYGLGVAVVTGPTPFRAPRGAMHWGGSEQTYFWADPVNQIAGIWMTQAYIDPFDFDPLARMQRWTYDTLGL